MMLEVPTVGAHALQQWQGAKNHEFFHIFCSSQLKISTVGIGNWNFWCYFKKMLCKIGCKRQCYTLQGLSKNHSWCKHKKLQASNVPNLVGNPMQEISSQLDLILSSIWWCQYHIILSSTSPIPSHTYLFLIWISTWTVIKLQMPTWDNQPQCRNKGVHICSLILHIHQKFVSQSKKIKQGFHNFNKGSTCHAHTLKNPTMICRGVQKWIFNEVHHHAKCVKVEHAHPQINC